MLYDEDIKYLQKAFMLKLKIILHSNHDCKIIYSASVLHSELHSASYRFEKFDTRVNGYYNVI